MRELLDTAMLDELRAIMEDDFGMLLQTFLHESEKQFQAVRTAWKDEDLESLCRAAHSLKGSCGNIGAQKLQKLCADLEDQARIGVTGGIEYLVDQAARELVEVQQEIGRL